MEKEYYIKRLAITDESLINDIFVDVFTNEPWNDDWSNKDQLHQYLEDIIGNRNSLSIGLFDKDELQGIALGTIMHWYSGTEYYIREFCIKRINQHKGLGSIFLNKIEEYLYQNQINSIILSTDIETPAYNFYVKNKFKELSKSRFLHKKLI